MSGKVMKWVNTVTYLATIIVNALANLLPLGGKTTGEVSAGYPNLFTPAPVTFAIWGVIYLAMGFFVVRQWGIGNSADIGDRYREKAGPWFALSCLFNIGWIFSWHFEAIGLSVILMLGLLLSLILTEIGVSDVSDSGLSRFFVVGGFDIYFGWIVAALLANTFVFMSQYDWYGLVGNDLIFTLAGIAVGTIAAVLIELMTGKWITAAAVAWAFVGILIKHIAPEGYAAAYPLIISTVIAALVIILTVILLYSLKNAIFGHKGEAALSTPV